MLSLSYCFYTHHYTLPTPQHPLHASTSSNSKSEIRKFEICYNLCMGSEDSRRGASASGTPGADTPAALRLTLPLPPGVNNQYATVNGRRVLSAEARQFKSGVKSVIDELRFGSYLTPQMLDSLRRGYLALFIDFYFASPLKRDLDGGLKVTQDALCEALEVNDNRVVDIHLVKRIDPRHPRIEVQLETIPADEWQFDEEYVFLAEDGS
jgi:crossover junction endodeoxyribonuclease RusA